MSDEEHEQGGPVPLGCAAWVVVWFALVFGFAAFGFRNGVSYLIGIPIALFVLPVLLAGIKSARVHRWPHEWGRFVLIAAGLSWIWYIPLTFLAIRIPPKAEADGTELSVTECLFAAAGQSFLHHALPMLPLAFIALVTLRKFYHPYYCYTERTDSLVYSGFLALVVWLNPFVYSHYYFLKTLTHYPIVWLVAIQLLLACACGFSIGYLPVCQRYLNYKRDGR